MKILALTSEFPPFKGGIGTYASEMARAAHELNAEITVAAPSYGECLADYDRRNFPFPVIRFAGGAHRTKDLYRKTILLRQLFAGRHYDLVHAMDWPFFLPATLVCRFRKRLYTIHGSDVLDMARPSKRAFIAASAMFRGDVRVLGNSRFTQDLFRANFPRVASSKIGYEHLGVSQAWLDHRGSRANRKQLGLPDDKIVLLTVARVTRRKGHLTVLKALESLPAVIRDQLFYAIAGPDAEPDYRDEINNAIQTSTVSIGRFDSLGNQALMDMCAASDIFCLPGAQIASHLVEGFGLVFLEAGSQSLPSIAGQLGGVAEVVEDEVSGLVVPTDDPISFARSIGRLVCDPDLRARLGHGARRRAEALSWRRCASASYGL